LSLKITLLTSFAKVCSVLLAALFLAPQSSAQTFEAGLQQRADIFSEVFDPQYHTSFHLAADHKRAKSFVRLNFANRFNQTGIQWEADTYPVFGNGFYGYLNYGYSNASIFPEHRGGAELYFPLPKRSEGSAGMRVLNFRTGTTSWLATASLSHYWRSYLFTIRPYFVFTDSGSGQTYIGSARYFLNDQSDYINLTLGAGLSSDRFVLQLGDGELTDDLLLLRSYQAEIELNHHITSWLSGLVKLGVNRQERTFDPDSFLTNTTVTAGLFYRF